MKWIYFIDLFITRIFHSNVSIIIILRHHMQLVDLHCVSWCLTVLWCILPPPGSLFIVTKSKQNQMKEKKKQVERKHQSKVCVKRIVFLFLHIFSLNYSTHLTSGFSCHQPVCDQELYLQRIC